MEDIQDSLSSERLAELRQLIRTKISSDVVQSKIRQCVSDVEKEKIKEEALLRVLEEKGLVDEVMAGIRLERNVSPRRTVPLMTNGESSDIKPDFKEGKQGQLIYFQILSGRAFIDYMDESQTLSHSTFIFHIYYGNQRFSSIPIKSCCDPEINEGFLLQIKKSNLRTSLPIQDMVPIADPIHIIMTSLSPRGETELLGTCKVNWRTVLCCHNNITTQTVELSGLKIEGQVPPGVLNLRWELMPKQNTRLNREVLEAQTQLEHQRLIESKRMFLLYAKQWWREYLAIRQNHTNRIVKIFADDETNESNIVCQYVSPLRVGRILDGPRHAARFVSLIDYRQPQTLGGTGGREGSGEVWMRLHSLLATKSGGCEDHCVLLCSLLLGYGLDAYVCLGTKVKGLAHSWVMTFNGDDTIVFWESLTAQRFLHSSYNPDTHSGTPIPVPSHPYRTIGCVFNDKSFYANIQPSDNVLTCQYDLHNGGQWKPMSRDAIEAVKQVSSLPPSILPSRLDPHLLSSDLEQELMSIITQHRMDCGLPTQWDTDLSYLLTPSLSSYELERKEGVSVGIEEFQAAIRRHVPEGHTFKGFPLQTNHCSAKRIFLTCLGSPICNDIIGCRGDGVRLALRVRVWSYPEDMCAVWSMLAVTYKCVL